jgi:2-isopropylmalate synthase
VSAVERSASYEHIDPSLVGNRRRILISELSGKASVTMKAAELKLDFEKDTESVAKILHLVKQKENKGFQYEGAEGSFVLLVEEALGKRKSYFQLEGFRVTVEKETQNGQMVAEATLKISVNGKSKHTVAEGSGPVDALDKALRNALEDFYPNLKSMTLIDFKVRVINGQAGTGARVRVLINSKDKALEWATVGVSENVIEASWQALVDAVEYKLFIDKLSPIKMKNKKRESVHAK